MAKVKQVEVYKRHQVIDARYGQIICETSISHYAQEIKDMFNKREEREST